MVRRDRHEDSKPGADSAASRGSRVGPTELPAAALQPLLMPREQLTDHTFVRGLERAAGRMRPVFLRPRGEGPLTTSDARNSKGERAAPCPFAVASTEGRPLTETALWSRSPCDSYSECRRQAQHVSVESRPAWTELSPEPERCDVVGGDLPSRPPLASEPQSVFPRSLTSRHSPEMLVYAGEGYPPVFSLRREETKSSRRFLGVDPWDSAGEGFAQKVRRQKQSQV